jgi:multisubunit Na+/H+ antiporter MnhE subunit
MLELIFGIILGAVFSDFWRFLFVQARRWVRSYMAKSSTS